jgi:hypothetical protein
MNQYGLNELITPSRERKIRVTFPSVLLMQFIPQLLVAAVDCHRATEEATTTWSVAVGLALTDPPVKPAPLEKTKLITPSLVELKSMHTCK